MLRSERKPARCAELTKTLGISAIATYEPPWILGNEWFDGTLSRKFVQHTGILSRRISLEDEVTMGMRAVENLQSRAGCDLRNCKAVVFAGSSLVHGYIARRYLSEEQARREDFRAVAREFVERLGIPSARVFGINWGCSGYSKAMEIAARCAARLEMAGTVHPGGHGEPNEQDHRLRLQSDRPDLRRFCPSNAPWRRRKPPIPDGTGPGLRRRRAAAGQRRILQLPPAGKRACAHARRRPSGRATTAGIFLGHDGAGRRGSPGNGKCRGQGSPGDGHPPGGGGFRRSAPGRHRRNPSDGDEAGGVGHPLRGRQRTDTKCREYQFFFGSLRLASRIGTDCMARSSAPRLRWASPATPRSRKGVSS